MNTVFFAGVSGILLSGIAATLLMLANVEARPGYDDPCGFSSGYGVGARACSDPLRLNAIPPAAKRAVTEYRAPTEAVDRN